jgi:hypothetical protein
MSEILRKQTLSFKEQNDGGIIVKREDCSALAIFSAASAHVPPWHCV